MNHKILLVEDDTLLSEMYSMALEGHGYDITLVKDGRTALETDTTVFDLVLLDVRIPEVSGLDVLKFYRQSGFAKPILIITNNPQVTMTEAKELGATSFLVKSHTDVGDMLTIVQSHLNGLHE